MQQTNTGHKSFYAFFKNAATLRSGIDWGATDEQRPVPFTDSASYRTLAGNLYSPKTVAAPIFGLPQNRYLAAAGAIFEAADEVQRAAGTNTPLAVSVPVSWVAEDSAPALQAATFAVAQSVPYTARAELEITRRLMKVSVLEPAMLAQLTLENALFHAVQAAIVAGTGLDNQPLGIANDTDNLGHTATAAAADITTALATALEAVAALSPKVAVIASPAARRALMGVATGNGTAWQMGAGGTQTLLGLPAYVESGLSGSRLLIGDFSNLAILHSPEVEYHAYGPADGRVDGGQLITAFSDVLPLVRMPAFGVITLS